MLSASGKARTGTGVSIARAVDRDVAPVAIGIRRDGLAAMTLGRAITPGPLTGMDEDVAAIGRKALDALPEAVVWASVTADRGEARVVAGLKILRG